MFLKTRLILPTLILGLLFGQTAWSYALVSEPATISILKDQGNMKTIQAVATIDAPASVVWNTLVNYGNLKNVLPGYERSTVLQSDHESATVDLAVKASAFLPAFRYQVKIKENRNTYTLDIQRISGDFRYIKASYQLIPTDKGKTRLVYHLNIDVGGKMPAFGSSGMLKNNTKEAMTALQTHCNQAYRKVLTAEASR